MASSTRKRDQLRALMKDIDIAMFTTLGERGYPVSRPLSTQSAEFDGEALWFFVRRDSAKVAEIARNAKVNVAYASQTRNVYLSVAGVADLVDDERRIDELWKDGLKAYFRKGRKDPNLALIRVRVHTVEYWDGPSSFIGKAIAFAIAAVTGDDSAMGENRMVRMRKGPPRHRGFTPAAKRAAAKKAPRKKAAAKRGAARKAPAKRTRR